MAAFGVHDFCVSAGVPDPHTIKQCNRVCRQLKKAMVDAISRDDVDAVKALLDGDDYRLDWLDDEDGLHHTQGHLPLHRAAHHAHHHIAELLLSYGANINGADRNGATALHTVAQNVAQTEQHADGVEHEMDHGKLVSYLLAQGAAVNAVDDGYGWTPLHWCAYGGHLEVAEMLVQYGANVNLQDASKATPLHLAAAKGHTDMASFLLDKGARTDIDNMRRKNPSEVAAKEGYSNLATILDPALDPNCASSYRVGLGMSVADGLHPKAPLHRAPPKPPPTRPPASVSNGERGSGTVGTNEAEASLAKQDL